jgi:putative DNA methylase
VAKKVKLIEVALPLEVINRESAREKSIRHGHPSTLHLWWARRPLAAARAVLFAQLVDDPSANPEQFPTEEAQKKERDRLHKIIERLVCWQNINDPMVLAEARAEISKSARSLPRILDPFAGGGTIPLEAERLGLEAFASDLNPIAVLINKVLIEYPPRFRAHRPVYPGLADSETAGWPGARGIGGDVRAYGKWMRDQAEKRIGRMYPQASLPGGGKATVIAWIWARTVACPNPACRINTPLVRSWWLGKKKGKEAFVEVHPPTGSSRDVTFTIGSDPRKGPSQTADGTVGRNGAICVSCNSAIDLEYIRAASRSTGLGHQLMAVVAEGNRRRIYLEPSSDQVAAAQVPRPDEVPEGEIFDWPGRINVFRYGMTEWADLFTNRQLVTLTTFCDLIGDVRARVLQDGLDAGLPEGRALEDEGRGAVAYADFVAILLSLSISRVANKSTSVCSWDSSPKMEAVRGLFARQAIPMAWDFAESNPLGGSSGDLLEDVGWVAKAIDNLPTTGGAGHASQEDAAARSYSGYVISTDPPYYDNIGYSDLSDFFYVWQRLTLRPILPKLFETVLVPKSEELVANPYRHNGHDGAREFFEDGFRQVFARAREAADPEYPITVYYAFKQAEADGEGQASTGWETLLEGMVENGWTITATWPLRSELSNRMIASGTNALASSIVLSLRPRPASASTQDRRGFVDVMKAELGPALQKLQAGGIAPVDLPQAAIGPGMAVFSRYSAVLEPDGSRMTVRSALARINEVLDGILSDQEGDFDPITRFAISWFRTHGYGEGKYGNADDLARARNTAITTLERSGILSGRRGVVKLYRPSDLSVDYDVLVDESVSAWEVLHHLIRILESEGAPAAGMFLSNAAGRTDGVIDVEQIPELSHLLFRIAEDNKWTKDAISFNSLVTVWPDIVDASRAPRPNAGQGALDFSADDEN